MCYSRLCKELEPSTFVREIIEHGYRIPFIGFPEPVYYKNHKLAFENAKFVEKAIQELLEALCVAECSESPIVCSPLSVVVSGRGKKRLVLDLHYVNQFILQKKFKYEGLDIVPQLFCKGDFFNTFDLKSEYHYVDIHKDCWPFLGFSWGEVSSRKWYVFKSAPFWLGFCVLCFHKATSSSSEALERHGSTLHCIHR